MTGEGAAKRLVAWARRRPLPALIWSKGWPRSCDFAGPETYWLDHTEACQPESFFRTHYEAARGLVWVRLSTLSRVGKPCDLDHFVRAALPTIREPFALVTSDGDVSVPSDLPKATVEALLNSPWLVSWHTQNHDGHAHPKLAPLPVGIDLHTRRSFLDTPRRLTAALARLRRARLAPDGQPLGVFCDLNKSQYSTARREAVALLRDCEHVDLLKKRVPQRAIWRRYANYPFVVSAMGYGLDCHRTWELLYLGCIVITKTSPLDPLYAGLPVVVVEDWREVLDKGNLARWLREYGPLTDRQVVWERLSPEAYLGPIREAVRMAAAGNPRPVVAAH